MVAARKLRQKQISAFSGTLNYGHTMIWNPDNPQPMSLLSINFLHLTVSAILPGQDFKDQGQRQTRGSLAKKKDNVFA